MLCDIENFSPDNLRAISHVNFYAIPFPSLSQQYGKINWIQYDGTNCTVYYAYGIGMAIHVQASGLTLQPGSVTTNIVATLPSNVHITLPVYLPCSLLTAGWTPMDANGSLSFSNSRQTVIIRVSGNAILNDAVVVGLYFFSSNGAYATE